MKVHDCVQGEAEWSLLRAGKVTASEADELLTPLFKAKTGEGPDKYLYKKLAEKWRGVPVGQFSSFETEQGQMLEDEARQWFNLIHSEHRMRTVGFCEMEGQPCGCSPDALLGEDGGLELKCPQDTAHVKYLMEGILPKDYAVQVHFSMYVTGRAWWKFLSYHRKYPKFVLRVERDEEICAKIAEAMAAFLKRFSEGFAKLSALN